MHTSYLPADPPQMPFISCVEDQHLPEEALVGSALYRRLARVA